jgi:hypothetical protein
VMSEWRRAEHPFTCHCCGELVVLGWAAGHNQYCDGCFGHLAPHYFCNGKRLAEALKRGGGYVRSDVR